MNFIVREYEVEQFRFLYSRVSGHQSDDELRYRLDDYVKRLQSASTRGLRSITIVEFGASHRYTALQRKIQSEWFTEFRDLLAQVELGVFYVVASTELRGGLTAITWISPLPFPYKICDNLEEALAGAFDACERSGLHVTADIEQQCRMRFVIRFPLSLPPS